MESGPAVLRDRAALLAFARRHPAGTLDDATLAWLFETADDRCVLDVLGRGERAIVGVVLDGCANGDGASELVVAGCAPEAPPAAFATLLAEAERVTRASGRALDVSPPRALGALHEALEGRGYRVAFSNLVLRARVDAPGDRDDAFRDVDDAWVPAAHACFAAAFARVAGAQIPSRGEFRAIVLGSPVPVRALVQDGAVAALARVVWKDEAAGVGEIRFLCRDPRHRGRGLGRRALDEALRVLARMGAREAHLEVASTNREALALYEGRGFALLERRDVFRRDPSASSPR
jgi:ribosomal protein S18 acetylase RimI-like enzyme